MFFLKTESGRFLNSRVIDQIQPYDDARRVQVWVAVARDGTSFRLDYSFEALEELLRPTVTVAAEPGFWLACCFAGEREEDDLFERVPVVAWRCDANVAEPVTPSTDLGGSNLFSTAIVYPNGRICESGDEWEDEPAWRAGIKVRLEAYRERKARNAAKAVGDRIAEKMQQTGLAFPEAVEAIRRDGEQ
jgi:hypothetical protein